MSKLTQIFPLILGLIFSGHIFANEDDFRCLKSVNLKKPIKLQFNFARNLGYVTYRNSNAPIPVKFKGEKTIKKVVGRPWLIQSVWEEITKDGIGGKYFITSQAANIEEFKYVRKDGKIFTFEIDIQASSEDGCRWQE